MAKKGGWAAKLVARQLATAALGVQIQTFFLIVNGRHKQRSGQHTLVGHKNFTKKEKKLRKF
jgi:hypothetical protein